MRNAGLRGGNQTQSRMRWLPARHSGEGPSRPPAPRARGRRPGGRGAPAGAWFCAGASGSAGSCPFSAMRTLFSEKSRDDEGIRRAPASTHCASSAGPPRESGAPRPGARWAPPPARVPAPSSGPAPGPWSCSSPHTRSPPWAHVEMPQEDDGRPLRFLTRVAGPDVLGIALCPDRWGPAWLSSVSAGRRHTATPSPHGTRTPVGR